MSDETTQDKHINEDTCTGHTPDVWQCQNPKCNATLDAGSIGRDGVGEEKDITLFCTSCSSRDVRLVEMKHPLFNTDNFEPKEGCIGCKIFSQMPKN